MLTENQPLNTAKAVWDFLCESAGVNEKLYDQKLRAQILEYIPEDVHKNENVFESTRIAADVFIIAFFKALQPYAQMLSDILEGGA